ncbi:hypothetical protein [Photobacterium damselae]|uniref:hypothetical protein n=1 Tax=Photobacterium damselae TaxID=38293 RepID=UPI004069518D
MYIKKITVSVVTTVEVNIDSSKFTSEFQNQFSKDMFELDGADEHAKHLAVLRARDAIGADGYVDGYGLLAERGISTEIKNVSVETDYSH